MLQLTKIERNKDAAVVLLSISTVLSCTSVMRSNRKTLAQISGDVNNGIIEKHTKLDRQKIGALIYNPMLRTFAGKNQTIGKHGIAKKMAKSISCKAVYNPRLNNLTIWFVIIYVELGFTRI